MLTFRIILLFLLLVDYAMCMMVPMDAWEQVGSSTKAVSGSKFPSMTIQQWNDASMRDAAMEIFSTSPDIVDSIEAAKFDSLRRRLRFTSEPRPHIAIARVVYESRRERFASHSIPYIFSSTIQHGAAGARFSESTKGLLDTLSLGIAPYTGSPCRFAHSERSIGIYLEEKLKDITAGSKNILIQIKTSLPPCEDCISFWSEKTILGKNESHKYLDFAHACPPKGKCGNCISRDWLKHLKTITGASHIEVSISCGVAFEGEGRIDDREFLRERR